MGISAGLVWFFAVIFEGGRLGTSTWYLGARRVTFHFYISK